MTEINVDVAIIGGGVAGLWLCNTLTDAGYSVLLLEKYKLGQGQTIASQGIIHGGVKYSLQGILSKETRAIADMPSYWNKCIANKNNIDLSKVKILSEVQHLWSNEKITSKLKGLFASFALNSKMQAQTKDKYPEFINKNSFSGNVYALCEKVLDVKSLISSLYKPITNSCIKADDISYQISNKHNINEVIITCQQESISIKAEKYIFTAGNGNLDIIDKFGLHNTMQQRPLHMPFVASEKLPKCYSHILGTSTIPQLTITTHYTNSGMPVWYIGGEIGETGINYSKSELITTAKAKLNELLPHIKLNAAQWGSIYIQRAEEMTTTGMKPQSSSILPHANSYICWPTKLTLTPVLTNKILQQLRSDKVVPHVTAENNYLPRPVIAEYPWSNLCQ